jgi:uncharacterized delta-60 repeat protein
MLFNVKLKFIKLSTMNKYYHILAITTTILLSLFGAHSSNAMNDSKLIFTQNSNWFIDNAIVNPNLIINELQSSNKSTFQLVSHGAPGKLLINGEWMNAQEIATFILTQTNFLKNTHHINIYGCNFARGAVGEEAVAILEKQLGISVAASKNLTGINGDWTLEIGQPKAAIAVSNYQGNLQSSPPMNLNQTSNYSFCQRLGFTSTCYGNLYQSGNDVAVNSSGIIAVDGLFTTYNYLNANGTVTGYPAPTYAFLNSDFTYNASMMPAYSVALDDTTFASCTLPQSKSYMTVTNDNCFIYQSGGSGLSPKIYKVCAGGVRTLLYSSSSTNPVSLYASKLGDYFFLDERTGINGPYVLKKISTITGAVDATFTYSSPTLGSSQILEAPNGTVYIIENGTLKRLTSTGAVDATFTTRTGVSAIALQSTGKVIAGGVFTSPGITRYNTDGSVDPTFNKITDFYVTRTTTGGTARQIRVNSSDEIYIAGTFNEVNGYACGGIVKLSADGVVDNAFRLNTKGGLYQGSGIMDMELQSDGKLLLALHGQQEGFGNLIQTGLVRILPNGKVDTWINNNATNLDAKVPTENDLLLCLGSIGGGYTSPVIGYNLSDYANFNQPGYNANPSLNGDTTVVNAFGQSQLEYSLVNQLYYMASTKYCVAYSTTDYSNSGKQDIAWAITLPPATASNADQIWDMNVSPDGKYLAVTQGIYNLCVLNAKTGAVVTANIPAAASGFISASYQPIPPYNLMVMAYSGAGSNQPVTLYRRTATGAAVNSITLQGTPNSGQITQSKMKWFSPVDFYYYHDGRFIYKYKLVTSATNQTLNVNGTYAKLDSTFSINGKMDDWLATTSNPTQQYDPKYDGTTVGPDGTLYTTQTYNNCTGGTGINIVKIAPVGNNVDYRFIQSTSVPNANTNNSGWITMALGQTGTCSTPSSITSTLIKNVCPSTTVNLDTVAITSSLPSGSTLVWSTHKVPTSSGDTLSNLNVSTSGYYYAMYYDKTYNCYGSADSIFVSIISCLPVTCTPPIALPTGIAPMNRGFGTSSDQNFGPNYVAVNSTGKILTTKATLGTYNGTTLTNTANLLNSDFTLSSFSGSGSTFSSSSTVLPNDNFVYLESLNSIPKLMNATTGVVTTFTTGLPVQYYPVVRRSQNHVYFIGNNNSVYRTDLNGVYDNTFVFSSTVQIYDVVEQTDGKVLVHAMSTGVKRLTSTGAVDPTWTVNSAPLMAPCCSGNFGKSLAIQSDEKILVVGRFDVTSGGNNYVSFIRLNTDGTVDNTFHWQHFQSNAGTFPFSDGTTADKIVVDNQDNIYVAGKFERNQDQAQYYIAKFNPDGSINQEFRENTYGGGLFSTYPFSDITVGADGKLIGVVSNLDGITSLDYNGIVRLLPNGKPDVALNNSVDNLSAACASSATVEPLNYAACTGSTSNLFIMYDNAHATVSPVVKYNLAMPEISQPGFIGEVVEINRSIFYASALFEEYGNYTYWWYYTAGSWGVNPAVDKVDNTTGQIVWTYTFTSNASGFLKDIRISPDGSKLALVYLGGGNGQIINTTTGTLMTTGVPVIPSTAGSVDWTPDGNYLYYINSGVVYSVPATGGAATVVTNSTAVAGGAHQTIRFAAGNPNLFYIFHYFGNTNTAFVTKFINNPTTRTATLDATWASSGYYFFTSGNVWGEHETFGVDAAGNIYVVGEMGSSSTTVKNNIVKLNADGVTINYNFIPTGDISQSAHARLTFGGGAACPCNAGTTAPAINETTASNTCPITTVNLATMTNSGSIPSGTTLVWSTHNPPTSSGDTLANLNVSTSGKYYAFYYDKNGNCYSPADSVTVTITIPCPVVCTYGTYTKSEYATYSTGSSDQWYGPASVYGGFGAPDVLDAASNVEANRTLFGPGTHQLNAYFSTPVKSGDTITLWVSAMEPTQKDFTVTLLDFQAQTLFTVETNAMAVTTGTSTAPYVPVQVVVPAGATGVYNNILVSQNTWGMMLLDAIKVSNTTCASCAAGSGAPILSSNGICPPATTLNVATITASNLPAGATLTWHSGTPASDANLVTAPTAATTGIYYAAFKTASNCYSGYNGDGTATTRLIVSLDTDCDGVVDIIDIDDDNDGVVDLVENNCTTPTTAPITSGFGSTTSTGDQGNGPVEDVTRWYPFNLPGAVFNTTGDVSDPGITYTYNFATPQTNLYFGFMNVDFTQRVFTDQNGNPIPLVIIDAAPQVVVSGDTLRDFNDCTHCCGLSGDGSIMLLGTYTQVNMTLIQNNVGPSTCHSFRWLERMVYIIGLWSKC